MANDGVPADGNWRDLARQIQEEKDPEKMIDLVQQLIAKFDEERVRTNPPTYGNVEALWFPYEQAALTVFFLVGWQYVLR